MKETPSREQNTESLVLRIRNGDADAEREFVNTFRHGLRVMLEVRTGDPELAADICQDAIMAVLTRLRSTGLDEPGKLKAFLRQTAINMYRNHARKESRHRTVPNVERVEAEPAETGNPVEALQQWQQGQAVRDIVETLSERDREIIWRFYIREQAKIDICEIMGLTPAQFDLVIFRARRRLKVRVLESAAVPT